MQFLGNPEISNQMNFLLFVGHLSILAIPGLPGNRATDSFVALIGGRKEREDRDDLTSQPSW